MIYDYLFPPKTTLLKAGASGAFLQLGQKAPSLNRVLRYSVQRIISFYMRVSVRQNDRINPFLIACKPHHPRYCEKYFLSASSNSLSVIFRRSLRCHNFSNGKPLHFSDVKYPIRCGVHSNLRASAAWVRLYFVSITSIKVSFITSLYKKGGEIS